MLLNVALHGTEQAAGVRYQHAGGTHAGDTVPGSPVLIRYADDLLALCCSQDQAEQVKASLAKWLAPKGLTFNEAKTRIVDLDDGFDFLGFTVRRFNAKLLIKPSKAAVRRIRERLRTEVRSLRGANIAMVLQRLTPIIRGWSAYYRTVVSSELFSSLDRYLWRLTYKWAKHSHPKKSKHWIVNRYFGGSTSPDSTAGCSATATAAPTWSSRLDQDRPTPPGQGGGVTRRPLPDRLLGRSSSPRNSTTDGQSEPAPIADASRYLPLLW